MLTCTFDNVDHFNNADETVARGAALQSALAEDASKYLTMIDATSQSLGVSAHRRDTCKEFYSIVIPKGSPLPAEHIGIVSVGYCFTESVYIFLKSLGLQSITRVPKETKPQSVCLRETT